MASSLGGLETDRLDVIVDWNPSILLDSTGHHGIATISSINRFAL